MKQVKKALTNTHLTNMEQDKKLEQELLVAQTDISNLRNILSDFVYMDAPINIHVCHKKRSKIAFFRDSNTAIVALINTTEKICGLICTKRYTEQHLASNAYNEQLRYSDYFRFNTQIILNSLKRQTEALLTNNIKGLYKKNEVLIGQSLFLINMLFNMSSFFDELYRSKLNKYKALYSEYELTDEQYIFQREHRQASHMRQNLMASEIFQASKMITVQYMYRNDISAVPVAIFQLRQSIELRILEILGIKGIMDKENCWMKITADSLINLLQIEQGYAFSESFAAIMKIHHWTNFFIHKGFVDNYWLLEFAQHYVKGFIFNTIIADKNFYNDIPKKLSEKLGCAVEQIVRSRNPSVKLIEDIDEFKKINEYIRINGYQKYYSDNPLF